MNMATDIIIISYKDEPELKKCLASIENYCKDYKVFIEDNNIPGQNRGFTKAVNDAIKKGSSEFIWCLNSDAVVKDEKTQQALIDRFSNPYAGIVGSMQLDPNNKDRIACGGCARAFPAGTHKGGLFSMGHCQIPEKQTWMNFASVMIRRSIIDRVGLLDEAMYLLYSDSSYCYSCRAAGFEVWYEPRSIVYHTLKASKNVSEWNKKDMEAFMKKWGITYIPETNSFQYSSLFQRLDMFP
jgi:GT2 family glycosyltransferase